MYKKIKNGSFMNWVWFIVAIMPILLLVIYSSTFIFNKQTNGYEIKNLINWQDDFIGKSGSSSTFYENNIFYYDLYLGDPNATINYNNNTILIGNYDTNFFDTYLEFTTQDNIDGFYYFYVNVESDYMLTNQLSYFDSNNELQTISINTREYYRVLTYFDSTRDNVGLSIQNNDYEGKLSLKINVFISKEEFSINLLNQQKQLYNVIVDSTYDAYLESINNTIQTNGFISSAFLNLAQLFGVTNVYYSLACYYIEYLLVIVLLHLAFDVLYMLPNICHKFMEKIGGERD